MAKAEIDLKFCRARSEASIRQRVNKQSRVQPLAVARGRELGRSGTKAPRPSLNARSIVGVFKMARSILAISAALLAAVLSTHSNAQTARHNFSGLCAFYPAHSGGLTAAHRTLPFGTHVRVTDPKTKRSVVVIINDRGPFGKRRVLDLSPSAARELGMISRGVIFVEAEVL
jgi:rare lipoprotein A